MRQIWGYVLLGDHDRACQTMVETPLLDGAIKLSQIVADLVDLAPARSTIVRDADAQHEGNKDEDSTCLNQPR
jgi:hypothetical protein